MCCKFLHGESLDQDAIASFDDIRRRAIFGCMVSNVRDHLLDTGRRMDVSRCLLEARSVHHILSALCQQPHDLAIEAIDIGACLLEARSFAHRILRSVHGRFSRASRQWRG